MFCVCVCVCLCIWGGEVATIDSVAIYIVRYILKQCFDQKYSSHFEYGSFPFDLWHGHCL